MANGVNVVQLVELETFTEALNLYNRQGVKNVLAQQHRYAISSLAQVYYKQYV